jgi:cell division protein ZapA
VSVNGRSYNVACEEGDEEHLRELARFFDKQVQELARQVGQVGETRLFLIAGLTAADDLSEALAKIDDLTAEIERLKSAQDEVNQRADQAESIAADMIDAAARRLEDIAGRLEAS